MSKERNPLRLEGKILWSGTLRAIKYTRKDDYDICRKCGTWMHYHRRTCKFYCPKCKELITEEEAVRRFQDE